MMRHVWVVARKELLECVRDRRSMISALISPLMGSVLIYALVHQLSERQDRDDDVTVHVQGAQHAPRLIDAMTHAHILIETAPQDPAQAILDQRVSVVLEIPASYDRDLAQGVPAQLEISADMSNNLSAKAVRRVRRVIQAQSSTLASLRMVARGVASRLLRPIEVHTIDFATDQQHASMLTKMLLVFALMSCALGGMYSAIDASAGERERKSLEPLLCTPAASMSFAVGKWLATTTMACLTCALTMLLLRQALILSPLESLGLRFSLSIQEVGAIFLCLVPLSMFMGAVQLVMATFTRSYREAQTYLTSILLIPVLPVYLYDAESGPPALWLHAIPTFGQYLQSLALLRGEHVGAPELLLGAGVCIVAVPLLLVWLSRLLRSEKIVYGRS